MARIYLDHAATTPMVPEAIEAMTRELGRTGNASSLHASGRAARPAVCREEGLPTVPRHRVIASTASGTIGVVAAWSR